MRDMRGRGGQGRPAQGRIDTLLRSLQWLSFSTCTLLVTGDFSLISVSLLADIDDVRALQFP